MADADALPVELASTIREGHFIVINNRPCKVLHVIYTPIGPLKGWCRFVGRDIFNWSLHESTEVHPNHQVQIPDVNRSDYEIYNINGNKLEMMNEAGEYKDCEVTNPDLLKKIRERLQAVRDVDDRCLLATVLFSMGEEQICTYKAVNPICPMEN